MFQSKTQQQKVISIQNVNGVILLVLNDKIRGFFSGLICILVVAVIIITGVFLLVGGVQAINKEVEKTAVPAHIE